MTALEPRDSARPAWHTAMSVALAVFGVCLPYAPAGISISLTAIVLLLATRGRDLLRAAPWREPVMALGLALLAFVALHSLVFTGWSAATLHAVNQYHELAMAPLLLVALREERHRRIFFRAFLVGCVALSIAYWASRGFPALYPKLAQRRISSGFAVAVAAFLLVVRSRGRVPAGDAALAAFFATTVFFAMDGRTGQVVLLVLAGVAAWARGPRRWRWAAAVGVPLVVAAVALTSNAVQQRLDELVQATHRSTPPDDADSSGVRLQLIRITAHLAMQHPLAGSGYGRYPQAHEAAGRDLYASQPGGEAFTHGLWMRVGNPHSEYLMQWIGGGAAALLLFIAWLGATLRTASRLSAPESAMLGGLAVAFGVGCLFNAMLLDFMQGHLYLALVPFVLAQARDPGRAGRAPFRRILVVATRQIGDVLLTTPLIRAVRRQWPDAHVAVLGLEGALGMLRGNPDIDALVETPKGRGWAALTWIRRLWRRYDLALVTDVGDRAHLIGWIAAPERSGLMPAANRSNWWKRRWLGHAVTAAGDLGARHAAAEKLDLLRPWADVGGQVPEVVPPPGAPLPADVDAALRPGFVIVHAPSMWSYKQWPLSHYEALVRALLADGRQVALTGSGGDRDQACIAPLRSIAPAPALLDVSGRLDFRQLVTLMARAVLYIGPDTSVSHLAAAVGVPTIAIFGPTNPQRWAPWPAKASTRELFARSRLAQQAGNVTLLQGSLACVPCGRAGCDNHRESRAECLPDIAPERVIAAARDALSAGVDRASSPR